MDNRENIEIDYRGSYIQRNNKKYIVYKECNEGHPDSYNFCIIKVENNNLVTLTKNTKHQTKIILENGVRHYSPYYTEYGLLTMSVYTHSINNKLDKDGGMLNVKYSISLNANLLSVIDITIEVEKII